MAFEHIVEFGNFTADKPILLRDFFKVFFVVYETMKLNRIELSRDCRTIRDSADLVKEKLNKHYKTEKVFENGLTNNSKLKIIVNSIHETLIDKNYVLNVEIVGEGTFKEIQILDENAHKKFKV